MRLAPQFRPDLTPYEAHAASLRLWLVEVLAWFLEILEQSQGSAVRRNSPHAGLSLSKPSVAASIIAKFAQRIRQDLRQTAHDLRRILLMHAFVRIRLGAPMQRNTRPHGAPAGVRLQHSSSGGRAFFSAVLRDLNQGSLLKRARRLKAILDDPEPYIARLVARLCKLIGRLRGASLVLAASQRERVVHAAHPLAVSFADTS
jgi:hypothetical protein